MGVTHANYKMEVVVISTQKRKRKTHKRVGREIRFKSAASRPPHGSGYAQEKKQMSWKN